MSTIFMVLGSVFVIAASVLYFYGIDAGEAWRFTMWLALAMFLQGIYWRDSDNDPRGGNND